MYVGVNLQALRRVTAEFAEPSCEPRGASKVEGFCNPRGGKQNRINWLLDCKTKLLKEAEVQEPRQNQAG
eukprot:6081008-Pyramimonas_sp.AAC.1